jgi:hypothetical protein
MRKNANVGPQGQVQYMTALNAGQNIGGNVDYVDADNFYPADGDLLDTRNQIDKIDMPYDNELNDLGSGADYFDGDEQNSYADDYDEDYDDYDGDDYDDYDGDDYDDFDGDDYDNYDGDEYDYADGDYQIEYVKEPNFGLGEYDTDVNDLGADFIDFFDGEGRPDYEGYDDYYDFDSDYDDLDGESFDYATGRRRRKSRRKTSKRSDRREERREERRPRRRASGTGVQEFAKDRLARRDARVDERRKARDERRRAKSSAKSAEIQSRADLTKSLAQPDTTTAQVLATLQGGDATKSATAPTERKGLSTGAVIGIALGSLALLGLGAYYVLKRNK